MNDDERDFGEHEHDEHEQAPHDEMGDRLQTAIVLAQIHGLMNDKYVETWQHQPEGSPRKVAYAKLDELHEWLIKQVAGMGQG